MSADAMAGDHPTQDERLALLYRISAVASSARTLDEILETLIRLAVSVTRCDACLLFLRSGDDLVLRASQLRRPGRIGRLRAAPGEGAAGWVFEHGAVVALESNASEDVRFKAFPSLGEETFEAFLSAPLTSGGEAIGAINIHHRERHRHSPDEIALALFLGEQMGGSIARARLEEAASGMHRQMEARKIVERAKGILQRTYNLSEEDAYLRLRNESRRSRRSMRELAEMVIRADGLARGGA